MALLGLALAACGSGDGGTLEAIIHPEGETSGFVDLGSGQDKSFGVFLCANGGSVELQSIDPLHIEGDIEFLGALVYTSPDKFVGAAHGYPAEGLDEAKTEPLEGATGRGDVMEYCEALSPETTSNRFLTD